jgi:hypothetical protein
MAYHIQQLHAVITLAQQTGITQTLHVFIRGVQYMLSMTLKCAMVKVGEGNSQMYLFPFVLRPKKKFDVSGYIGQKIRVGRSAKNFFFQIYFTAQILVKIN